VQLREDAGVLDTVVFVPMYSSLLAVLCFAAARGFRETDGWRPVALALGWAGWGAGLFDLIDERPFGGYVDDAVPRPSLDDLAGRRRRAGALQGTASRGMRRREPGVVPLESLTVSFPIPQLSRPLIPNVDINPPVTLKTALKKAVSTSGPSLLIATLKNQGRSDAEATAEAQSVFRHITPAVEFLADQANVFALKPLFMVDASQITSASTGGNDVRLGIGGGLQLTIIVARLEIGYVSTVLRVRGDQAGNAFFRMTFQNLF